MIARKLKLHKIKIFAYCLAIIILWLIFSRRDFYKSRYCNYFFKSEIQKYSAGWQMRNF